MEHYFMKIIYDLFQVPLIRWGEGEVCQIPAENEYRSPLLYDEKLKDELQHKADSFDTPILYLENQSFYYGLFRDRGHHYVCVGPVSVRKVRKIEEEEYKRLHQIEGSFWIPCFGMGYMTKVLTMLFSALTGRKLEYADVSVKCKDEGIETWSAQADVEGYLLSQADADRDHGIGIVFERKIVEIVKQGDVEAMKDLMSGNTPNMQDIGELSDDQRKQMEYLAIITVTLITRAAVEGGMNPEEAYVLGDVYLRRIRQHHGEIDTLTMLGMKAQIEFTERVREAKQQGSRFVYVDRCKDYIAKNLRKGLKIGDIASAIGISQAYLSHKFKEIEGMSIQMYVLQEKCIHAANVLTYSDYSITAIAEYFSFSSSSHFSSVFKRYYGMTPQQYRMLHGKEFTVKTDN